MHLFDITIAGELNLDLILYGYPEEVPVERELLADDFKVTLGSSSAILAHNLAVLGAKVGFATCTGNDDLGRIARERLTGSGVDLSRARVLDATGTGVTIMLPHGKTRHMFTYAGTIAALALADLDMDYLASAPHFHLSSLYLQRGLTADVPKLFEQLKQAGLTISLDTNDDPDDRWGYPLQEILPLVDVFLPNERELLRITKKDTLEAALDELSPRVRCIAVKCGARGSVVKTADRFVTADPVAVSPVDTIGAGDSYNAGFLFAWLQGHNLEECARAGNITGALSTLRAGGTEAFRDASLMAEFLSRNSFPIPAEKRA
ncbi:MAG TPA: carbohydrate kinase family protein [Acidobacteriaceae bacterium]|nr:carbohydrate kinase family protein [Acidobacteriaceae bacterium]